MRPPLEVTIRGPRGDEWEKVCGTRTFPVTTWNPMRADLPGKPNAEVWFLHIILLGPGMLDKIVAHMANKFAVPLEELRREVDRQGIPILAEDGYVHLNDLQRWVG